MFKLIAGAGALAVAFAAVSAAEPPSTDVEALAWLAGCWERNLPDGSTEEHWMKPSGGSMLGMSRTVRGGRTTEFEFLQIGVVDGGLAYIARPSGQAEATFPLKAMTEREVVFENPTHDFPQRIVYRHKADGTVTARIEGQMNGRLHGTDFPYRRCR
jgi:hypothetical protein